MRVGAAAALAGGALLCAAPFVGSPAGAAPTGNITITHTAAVAVGPCIGQPSLSYTVFSDASIFRLRVVAPSAPCQPIAATAVIYAMPGGGAAWPQQLKESVPFTIDGAGTTDITFTKNCTPVQFDVVTGATPATISPLGQMHGPLLFVGNTDTAFQDVGAVCEPTTTTTGATTTTIAGNGGTTTVAPTTTTTTAPAGATTSTTVAVVEGTSVRNTTTTASVLGTSTSRSSSDPSPSSLAVTGVSSVGTTYAGALLLVAGVVMIVTTRRRAVPSVRMITSSASVSSHSPFGLD
ncbi:MAG: hypothetical protein U0Q22_14590 [Acidimicrobiales bacterium]